MTGLAARRGAVRLVLAAVAAVLCWATVPPAAAHDELLFSDPSESGVLRAMPSRAILTFTGPVAEVHEVTVTGPDGSVANGTPTASGPEVRQNLWAGPDGAYTLTYDVVSSDGHEMAGEIRFEVGDGTPDEVGAAASSPVRRRRRSRRSAPRDRRAGRRGAAVRGLRAGHPAPAPRCPERDLAPT